MARIAPGVRTAGFTLLELIVVVAVLGILVSIALPSFKYLAASTKMKTAATNLHLALLKARSEAIKRDTSVVVTPNGGDWAAGWQITAGATVLMVQQALPGVSVTRAPASITYLNSGRVQAGGASTCFNISFLARNTAEKVNLTSRCVSWAANGSAYAREADCPVTADCP